MKGWSGLLRENTRWDGEVLLEGDLVVPEGIRLTLAPGTRVAAAPLPAWSCAVFRSAREGYPIEATRRRLCDIVVLGELRAEGTEADPIRFGDSRNRWGGISWLSRGRGSLRWAFLENAEESVLQSFDHSRLSLQHCALSGPEVGLWTWGFSEADFKEGRIDVPRCGVLCCEGSRVRLQNVSVRKDCREAFTAEKWSRVAWSNADGRIAV